MKKNKYAKLLIQLRNSCGWSQSELARQIGITSAAISQIEKGDRTPSLDVAEKIARAFNISLDDFSNYRTLKNEDVEIFYRKFSLLRQLKHEDQNLILTIAMRLLP